jgi:hypothetical protein
MVVGLPAYAEEIRMLDADTNASKTAARNALSALGWEYEVLAFDTFVARVPTSLFSWGEKVTVKITKDRFIAVRSEGILFTQFIDWGKNRRNIKLFFEQLGQTLPSAHALNPDRRPAPPFDDAGMTPLERVFNDEER